MGKGLLSACLAAAPLLVHGQAKHFSDADVCRAAVSALMGRPVETIKYIPKADPGVVHVAYVRPDDGTLWASRCKLAGARITWAAENGRWRDMRDDTSIAFIETPTVLTIELRTPSNSPDVSRKLFTETQLRR